MFSVDGEINCFRHCFLTECILDMYLFSGYSNCYFPFALSASFPDVSLHHTVLAIFRNHAFILSGPGVHCSGNNFECSRQTMPALIVNICGAFAGVCGNSTGNGTDTSRYETCGEHSYFAMFLFAVYMVMTNVLLLNLLIALFK